MTTETMYPPETEAVINAGISQDDDSTFSALVELSRKLERQRDELAAALRRVTDSLAAEINPEAQEIVEARALLARVQP